MRIMGDFECLKKGCDYYMNAECVLITCIKEPEPAPCLECWQIMLKNQVECPHCGVTKLHKGVY